MTKPVISGLKYCTVGVPCSPILPALSRKKQATQTPMLGGLPAVARIKANAPMMAPEITNIHVLDIIFIPMMAG
ncbi:Uncharacterised protein [Leminorella grimontii]|uniref:hypothetical protein n=1 Tax=Leminorella grimontii TaxID=82981 RepID=UPI0010AF498F|nr:hypothetical protein [Leminorella grimontii]VFS58301.1 Uncharacterised protein [Leminorella grimontii]